MSIEYSEACLWNGTNVQRPAKPLTLEDLQQTMRDLAKLPIPPGECFLNRITLSALRKAFSYQERVNSLFSVRLVIDPDVPTGFVKYDGKLHPVFKFKAGE